MNKAFIGAAIMTALAVFSGCGNSEPATRIEPSKNNWKEIGYSNPVSPNVFCADPTAVEYEGRLYTEKVAPWTMKSWQFR